MKTNNYIKKIIGLAFTTACLFGGHIGWSQIKVDSLHVEYRQEPLGIDVKTPRFGWQLLVDGDSRGIYQKAYQLKVSGPDEDIAWDSGRVESGTGLGIIYEGKPLEPATRYRWELTVWDQDNKSHTAASWFETGLLDSDPDAAVWEGAEWIGGGPEDMQLYSHYLSVFKLNYSVQLHQGSKSTKAAFVLGANDIRLMDKNLNIQGVASGRDQHYVSFELDISGLANGQPAQIHVYRVGYAPSDSAETPFKSFPIPEALVNNSNKYNPHSIYIECNFGLFQVFVDGTGEENAVSTSDNTSSPFADPGFNVNPVGSGNNYISFPMLADIGFRMNPGQQAAFSKLVVKNFREPSNVLISETFETPYDGLFTAAATTSGNGVTTAGNALSLNGGETGLLLTADPSKKAAPMLRTEFALENKTVASARIYSTARGIYELYLNGERVGDHYFTPGLTQYNKTHQYQIYDITPMLKAGSLNAIGAWLSEGWWAGNITYSGENWNFFGDRPSFRGMVRITYEDGSEQVVISNAGSWKLFTEGPLRYGSFFQGEVYDARKEEAINGWAEAGYNDADWQNAKVVPLQGTTFPDLEYDALKLIAQIGESPSMVKSLKAQTVEEVREGVYIYDMGQNMVGFPRIVIENGDAGDTLVMRYAEVKYPDLPDYQGNEGMIMLENIRAALTQDLYILKGGREIIQPRFTFHGYRFLELSGLDSPVALENIEGQVISSIHNLASSYETSNELVNKLWENISWSLRGNFLSIPTDTPARNERMGWSGDINVFSEAATYLAHAGPFLDRHLLAMRDIQREDGRFTDVAPVGGGFGGTLWGSAGIIVPWEVYQQYGDKRVLEAHYAAMQRYMDFLESKTDPETGRLEEGPLGDWLSPEGSKNDNTLMWAAYQTYNYEIMAKVAGILGKEADANTYRKKYGERKAYFNKTYVDPQTHKTVHSGYEGRMFGPPPPDYEKPQPGSLVDTQASYAIPLNFEVFNEEHRPHAVEHLAAAVSRKNRDDLGVMRPENSLMTGFIGTASLSHALSEGGKDSLAYTLLQQQTYPSWLYSVVNGATTIWERLNSYTIEDGFGGNNSMNSFNHYSFGAVAAWMYNHSLGIQRDVQNPGFKHFILSPTPDPTGQMSWAKGYYDSMYGRIESSWRKEGSATRYSFTVPANTTATLRLKGADKKNTKEAGKALRKSRGISQVREEGENLLMELASGSYTFKVE